MNLDIALPGARDERMRLLLDERRRHRQAGPGVLERWRLRWTGSDRITAHLGVGYGRGSTRWVGRYDAQVLPNPWRLSGTLHTRRPALPKFLWACTALLVVCGLGMIASREVPGILLGIAALAIAYGIATIGRTAATEGSDLDAIASDLTTSLRSYFEGDHL